MNRREFLGTSISGLATIAGLSVFGPLLTYFFSPVWKETPEEWILLGETGKIPAGKPTKIEFLQRRKDGWMTVEEKKSAWVVNKEGKEFTVFDPRCTHLGCPYRWDEAREQFLCPCHTAVFGVDGNVISGPPPRPLDRFTTKIENGKLWVLPAFTKGHATKERG